MEKRRFGRTGHMSSVAIFGAAALGETDQAVSEKALDLSLKNGVNHIDVAPSYGEAEVRIGAWLPPHRDKFFLGCKTMERTADSAHQEMMASLKRLNTDHFELYQLHAVTSMEKLDKVTGKGGALETAIKARDEGITQFIGITGHGSEMPRVLLEALKRFDFDTVLFPLNPTLLSIPDYAEPALELLEVCGEKDVGVMIIKSIAKQPWGDRPHTSAPWYEPFIEAEIIQDLVSFALSYPVTGICTVSDVDILPYVLDACNNFTLISPEVREAMIEEYKKFEPVFTPPWLL